VWRKLEVIKFDGFLKVYLESSEEENGELEDSGLLPNIKEGSKLEYEQITATERFTRPPARFTEASLVKKLEEMEIGRPSTYAPTISTIQKRGYVHKDERTGTEREYNVFTLIPNNELKKELKIEITGADKGKLFPADIAMLVTDFLVEHFPRIMNFKFTAHIEEELDEIARGEIDKKVMLDEFYFPFKEKVDHTIENSERVSGERVLGKDPKTGQQVSVRMARFGPVAQLTDLKDPDAKPQYAGLRREQKLETITLDEALVLFQLPRSIGEFEDEEVSAAIGRFGPYVRHDGKFYSLKKEYDPHTITLDEAIEVIETKRKTDKEKIIKLFDDNNEYQILNGRWGPYLKAGTKNIRLPKDRDPASFTLEDCLELEKNYVPSRSRSRKKGKKK
jgi:DNA topoisomerase-1